jgi:hypothetical protein
MLFSFEDYIKLKYDNLNEKPEIKIKAESNLKEEFIEKNNEYKRQLEECSSNLDIASKEIANSKINLDKEKFELIKLNEELELKNKELNQLKLIYDKCVKSSSEINNEKILDLETNIKRLRLEHEQILNNSNASFKKKESDLNKELLLYKKNDRESKDQIKLFKKEITELKKVNTDLIRKNNNLVNKNEELMRENNVEMKDINNEEQGNNNKKRRFNQTQKI